MDHDEYEQQRQNNTAKTLSKANGQTFSYNGQRYPVTPSISDQLSEAFKSDDDRSQIQALRRQRAAAVGG